MLSLITPTVISVYIPVVAFLCIVCPRRAHEFDHAFPNRVLLLGSMVILFAELDLVNAFLFYVRVVVSADVRVFRTVFIAVTYFYTTGTELFSVVSIACISGFMIVWRVG